jgi:peptide deformylase
MLNPRVTSVSNFKVTTDEKCLSVPGVTRKRQRPKSVKVAYLTAEWKRAKVHLKNIEAICFGHEMDHLLGKTIADT